MSNKFADLGFEPVETVDAFDSAFKRTLGFEGGYTVDHAGATNFGVTQDTYDNWRKKQGLQTKPVRAIDPQEAKQLYKQEYFDKPGFSKLPANVAGVLFDYGVNAGTPRAAMALQKAVGASPDGVIGSKTLNKVNDFVARNGEQPLLQNIVDQRSQHIDTLIKKNPAKYKKFENGWKNRINAIKSEFKLSDLNPFSATEASADEGVQNDFTDLGFEESATPIETLPQATGNFDDLGFQPEHSIPQLSADKNFDRYAPIPEKMQATQADFDFFTQNLADKLARASSGQTVPEMIESKNKLNGIIMRAPMLATLPVAPIASAVVEGLTQAKNLIVSNVKKEKYNPIEIRVLNELLPKETPTAARIAAMGGEALTDVALLGGLSNLAKQGLLKDTIKEIGMKLERAGYGTGQKTINMDVVKEAARGSTLDIEAERWLKAKLGDVKPKNNIGTTTPEKQVAGIAEPTVTPKTETSVEPVQPKPVTPVERAAQHGEVVGIDAKSGLPVIDTTVKPVEKIQTYTGEERRDSDLIPQPTTSKNRLSDWTPLIDAYDTPEGKKYQIERLDVSDTVKAKLLDHYGLLRDKTVVAAQTSTPTILPKPEEALAPSTENIVTDPVEVNRIKNSILEGENILKVGTFNGRKLSEGELFSVQRAVNNSKAKIGIGGDYNGKSQETSKKGLQEVLIPQGQEAVTQNAPVTSVLENKEAINFYNDSVKTNKVTENNAPEKSFNVGRILDNVKNVIGIKGNNVFISAKKIAHIFKQRQKHSDFIISNIDRILNTDEVYRNVSNEGVLRDDKSYLFVKRLHRNFVAVVEVNVSKDGNEIRTIMTKDSREIKKLEPFKIPVVKAGEAPDSPIQGIEPSAARRLSTLQHNKNISQKYSNVNTVKISKLKKELELVQNGIEETTSQISESEAKQVNDAFAKETSVDKPTENIPTAGKDKEDNITPSGQIRPELLPPERKELFQEEGELFKKFKGTEAATSAESIDNYEGQTPEKKDAEFKLFKAVQELAKKWVKSPIGERYNPKGTGGVRFGDNGTILVRSMNNLSFMIHEVTHDIAKNTSFVSNVMKIKGYAKNGNPIYAPETKSARKELTNIYVKYYNGGKADHKLETRVNEGLSMLLQRMVEAPELTKKEFPYLYANVITPNGKYYNSKYTELINDGQNIVKQYQSLSPLKKIGARVVTAGRDLDKKSFLNTQERIIEEAADRIYPIEKMAKETGLSGTVDDPSLWARAYNVIRYVALENINTKNGYITIRDGEFKKIYDFNWKTLLDNLHKQGGDANIEDFSYWLVARQTHYLYERLDNLKKEALSAIKDIKEKGKDAVTKEELKTAQDKVKEYKELKLVVSKDNIKRELATSAFKSEEKRFEAHAEMFDKLVRADLDLLHSKEVQLVNAKRYEKMIAEKGYAPRQRDIFNEIIGTPSDDRPVARSMTGKSKISSMLGRTGSELPIVSPVYGAMMNHLEILKKANRQIIYNIIGEKVASHYPELFRSLPLTKAVDDTGRISYPQEKDRNIMMTYLNYNKTPFLVDEEVKSLIDDLFTFEDRHLLEKALVKASSLFTKGTTGLYPPFAIANFIVDQFTALAQTRNNLIPVISQVKMLYKMLSNSDSKEAEYFKEYLMLGGERQTYVEISELSPEDSYRELLKERDALHKVIGWVGDGVNILSLPSKYSEIVTRGAEYVLARKAGKPQLAALEEAGRVTAPFHHEGRAGGHVGRSYIKSMSYFKARLQVLAQFGRTLKDKKTQKRALFVIAGLTAASIASMMYLINNSTKEQKENYNALLPRETSGYIFLPHWNGKDLIRIRVPEQMNVIATMTNMLIADSMNNAKYKPYDYVSGATSWAPDQLNITDPQRQFLSLWPQIVVPSAGVVLNKRTYPDVRDLESQSMQARPAKYRYYENTSNLAKAVGDKLNLSPIKIDFLLEGYTGRVSKFATGKGIPNPLVRKVYLTAMRQVENYYDLSKQVDQEYKAINDKMRKEKYSGEKHYLYTLNEKMKIIDRKLDKYRDLNKLNKSDPKLYEIRREILDSIDTLPASLK